MNPPLVVELWRDDLLVVVVEPFDSLVVPAPGRNTILPAFRIRHSLLNIDL